MQLPFVLQSAEVMKTAVAYLEPHMEKADAGGKGTIVLATVKGDVHDIGKNLVDIILSNNGYTVVNLGIKQPITRDPRGRRRARRRRHRHVRPAGQDHGDHEGEPRGDELPRDRGAVPGAARRRGADPRYVEHDLAEVFDGDVRYARDAFEGLRLMDALMAAEARRRDHATGRTTPAVRRRGAQAGRAQGPARAVAADRRAAPGRRGGRAAELPARSDVATDNPMPTPPFWGARVVKGIALADYAALLDERATFMGQWGLRGRPGRRRARPTRSWWRPRAGRGCGTGWTGSRPRASSRPPSSTATSRASARATT